MTLTRMMLVAALAMPALFGQQTQPVQDVDKDARNAVWGYCTPIVVTGQKNVANADNCTMGRPTGGTFANATIPAGRSSLSRKLPRRASRTA
ncbi:MAG: hypothetical protein R2729_20125 [Bryobacteraceae bacterium]